LYNYITIHGAKKHKIHYPSHPHIQPIIQPAIKFQFSTILVDEDNSWTSPFLLLTHQSKWDLARLTVHVSTSHAVRYTLPIGFFRTSDQPLRTLHTTNRRVSATKRIQMSACQPGSADYVLRVTSTLPTPFFSPHHRICPNHQPISPSNISVPSG